MNNKSIKLYNILFPIWLLIWFPLLWIVLIPANYAIDYLVLYLSLKGNTDQKALCRNNTWKVCLVGFLADFVGSALLFPVMLLGGAGACCFSPAKQNFSRISEYNQAVDFLNSSRHYPLTSLFIY